MSESAFEILGDAIVRDLGYTELVGAEQAFDPKFLVNAGAELANRGITYAQDKKAAEATAADVEIRAAAVIALDVAATEACANATVAALLAAGETDPAKKADSERAVSALRAVAESASASQDAAAAGLPAAAQAKRIEAAKRAADAAAKAWAADPKNRAKEAKATCARATLIKATGGSGSTALVPTGGGGPTFLDFLKQKRAGVPVWGWGAITLAGIGALATLGKLLARRR